MKKILFLIVISFILFESCNTDFSINDPGYEDIYVLNCILQNDNSIQYAILSKNIYTESGGTPASNSKDQYIKGANVKIFYNNSVFVMKDTTLQIITDGNITEVNCYYTKGLIVDPGKIVSIEATAPNGKILKSSIQIPEIFFPQYFNYNIPPGYPDANYFYDEFGWSWIVNNLRSTDIINLPQIEVYYKKLEGGTFVEKKIIIPLGSFTIAGYSDTPIYTNAGPSYNYSAEEFFDIINTKMQEISGNDPNKQNYIIEKATFSVLAIDPLLSAYYSKYTTYSQSFSVKLYSPDYSNIQGGKGIFGMYYNFSKSANIDSLYVYSFGYQYKRQ
jgi:hypothetical protein